MEIINVEDKTPEWKEWRKNGIGSSDIAAIVGHSPFKSAYTVFEEKKGLVDSNFMNPAMMRGNMFEDPARKAFNQEIGAVFTPMNVQHDTHDFFRASLDGYNKELNTFVEIKVPSDRNFQNYYSGEIPPHYYIQVQWQMLVTNIPECYFAIFNPEEKTIFIIKISKCEKTQKLLKDEGLIFWDNLLNDIPPPLQQKDYRFVNNPDLKKLEEEYVKLDEQKKAIDKKLKELKPNILDFGDGGNFKTDKLTVFLKSSGEKLDKKKMQEDGIDLTPYTKPASYFYNIRIN